MYHKRHSLELLELFKQSRENAQNRILPGSTGVEERPNDVGSIELVRRPQYEAAKIPTTLDSSAPTSYLPKIKPMERRPSVMEIRKDTLVVGAVFVVVLAGLTFLLGRNTTIGDQPQEAAVMEEVVASRSLADVPIVAVPTQEVEKVAEKVIPQASETPKKPEAEPTFEHTYQVVTTGIGEDARDGAERLKEFLLGNGHHAKAYQTSSEHWTVRVFSNDDSGGDLERIKDLEYRGHRPFHDAFKRHD